VSYFALKHLHQWLVVISALGFVARSAGHWRGAAWVRGRLARIAPHVIDTLLLATGVWLAWTLRLTPGQAPWLLAKIIGLLGYIALGVMVMRGRHPALRGVAFGAALLVLGWIASVAITKSAWGWLAP
jgi:uncharacterized membrane protein SirB2